jgi:hypothetical protein
MKRLDKYSGAKLLTALKVITSSRFFKVVSSGSQLSFLKMSEERIS